MKSDVVCSLLMSQRKVSDWGARAKASKRARDKE